MNLDPQGSSLRRALFSGPARRRWRVATLVLAVAVVALALLPLSLHGPSLGWDKANHAVAFAALAVCGALGLRGAPNASRRLVLGLLALGIGIEVAQSFTPDRRAEWQDVVADAVGMAIGLLVARTLAARLDRRRAPRPDAG